MRILLVEPTPSPHTLRCALDQRLDDGLRFIYTSDQFKLAPEWLQSVLLTKGVRSVMHVADFIAIDKDPTFDWIPIIQVFQKLELFGDVLDASTQETNINGQHQAHEEILEIRVYVQQFMQLPIQWKLMIGLQETRIPAPDRFRTLVMKLSQQGTNLIHAREWVELERRYGQVEQIADELRLEAQVRYAAIAEQYEIQWNEQLVQKARQANLQSESEDVNASLSSSSENSTSENSSARDLAQVEKELLVRYDAQLKNEKWQVRYQTLIEMQQSNLTVNEAVMIAERFEDSHYAVRRMAGVVYAQIKNMDVLPKLIELLADASPIVRRTVGDTLTDLGDRRALVEMKKLLRDPSRIVRWRAARFLYEFGDSNDLDVLEDAKTDDAFEVQLQIRMAMERIASGQKAAGSIWQQMGGGNS